MRFHVCAKICPIHQILYINRLKRNVPSSKLYLIKDAWVKRNCSLHTLTQYLLKCSKNDENDKFQHPSRLTIHIPGCMCWCGPIKIWIRKSSNFIGQLRTLYKRIGRKLIQCPTVSEESIRNPGVGKGMCVVCVCVCVCVGGWGGGRGRITLNFACYIGQDFFFIFCHTTVAGYYGITLAVRVRPSVVRPSVRIFVSGRYLNVNGFSPNSARLVWDC